MCTLIPNKSVFFMAVMDNSVILLWYRATHNTWIPLPPVCGRMNWTLDKLNELNFWVEVKSLTYGNILNWKAFICVLYLFNLFLRKKYYDTNYLKLTIVSSLWRSHTSGSQLNLLSSVPSLVHKLIFSLHLANPICYIDIVVTGRINHDFLVILVSLLVICQ